MLNKEVENSGENYGAIFRENHGIVTVHHGVDEKRVREICNELFSHNKNEIKFQAMEIANERMDKLEKYLDLKIQVSEETVKILQEPAVQILLRDAQEAAACSEKESDYELLAELISKRLHRSEQRSNSAISRAVKLIDKIDDESLHALTLMVIFIYSSMTISLADTKMTIKIFAEQITSLMYRDLPETSDWIDYLSELNVIHRFSFGYPNKIKDFDELLLEKVSPQVSLGIPRNSENFNKALKILKSININSSSLVPNEFLEGYVKLTVSDLDTIKNNLVLVKPNQQSSIERLSEEQIQGIISIRNLYEKNHSLHQQVLNAIKKEFNNYDDIIKLRMWWNRLPCAFAPTSVASVIAFCNSKKFVDNLPNFVI